MSGIFYYQRNRDVILNKAKDYYENNKERLRKINIENNLKKIKIKNKEYQRNRYHNISEEKKQKLKE